MTPSNEVLVVHPFGSRWDSWSLPKGIADTGESAMDAAARELQEETGLIISPTALIDFGVHPYLKDKDYHLFIFQSPHDLTTSELFCSSYFINKQGVSVPEVDGFRLVPTEELHVILNAKQAAIIKSIPTSALACF